MIRGYAHKKSAVELAAEAKRLEAENEREEALAEIAEARDYVSNHEYFEEEAARRAFADYEGFNLYAA